jgi:hypothetical protein
LQKLYDGRGFIERVRAGKIKSRPANCIELAKKTDSGRSQYHDNSGILPQSSEIMDEIITVLPIAVNRLGLYIPPKLE